MTLQRRSLRSAPAVLNTADKAFWVTGWNEAVDALEAEQAQAVEPIGYIRHADKTFWPHPECAVYASVSPSLVPVYGHPAPPATSERAVEPVATVQCINGVTIGYLDVMQPVGTKLYTHLAPPPATSERAELIAGIKHELAEFAHNKTLETLLLDAANMLEADTQEIAGWKADQKENLRNQVELQRQINSLKAQQVAVPMTEAQIFECDPVPHVMFDQQRIDFARAIEAFHGIGAKP